MKRQEAERILHNLFTELEAHGPAAQALLALREDSDTYRKVHNACVSRILITAMGQDLPYTDEWKAA